MGGDALSYPPHGWALGVGGKQDRSVSWRQGDLSSVKGDILGHKLHSWDWVNESWAMSS